MAAKLMGLFKLPIKCVFFLFLLVGFDSRKCPTEDSNAIFPLNNAVKVHVAQQLSTPEITGVVGRKLMLKRMKYSLLPSGLKCLRAMNLTRSLIMVNLLLLSNDIALNPGPSQPICVTCTKAIKQKQARVICSQCCYVYHTRCVGVDFENTKTCRLCSPLNLNSLSEDSSNGKTDFVLKLENIIMERGLKCVHQNIRSLPKKIDELRSITIESKCGIHLIALTETWLSEQIMDDEIDISGYKVYRKDRSSKGGGVAVYVRDDLPVVRRPDLENDSLEGLWLEIVMPNSRGFLLGSFYRPPDSSNHHEQDFMVEFSDVVESLSSEGREILLVGDFNCDFSSKRSTHSVCKQFKLILRSLDFTQLINLPTRITQQSSTLLDLAITNYPQNISQFGVLTSHLSDHEMVYFIRKLNWKRYPSKMKTFRNYVNYDASKFCDELNGVDWDSTLSYSPSLGITVVNSVDEQWSNFKSTFLSIANRHAPLMEKRVRGLDCPWMTGDIKRTIRQRDYHLIIARRSNKSEDWSVYRSLRNCVTKLIRVAKSKYNRRLLEENAENPKNFWKALKTILPGEKKNMSSNISVDGNLLTDSSMIADSFNHYFVETVSRLVSRFGVSTSAIVQRFSFSHGDSPVGFNFEDVPEQFTYNQLRKLKNGKAVGLDHMPVRLLKDSASVIAKPLSTIINNSLSQSRVPDDWKSARVIPLFKGGKVDQMENYRPISILSTASKILERAVHVQLHTFLSNNKLLNPFQCGFRKKHSTDTAVIAFTDHIRRHMDQGLLTGAVFIDLRKAFDTVDHTILLDKLYGYGIKEGELQWFQDYLNNRSQVVEWQNKLSFSCSISSGVPQGSILGPLLFVLYINDLPDVVVNCNILLYADDAVLYFAAKDVVKIEEILSRDLMSVNDWILRNCLFLHKSKTEVVLFGTSPRLSNVEDFRIVIGDYLVKRVTKFKYLGVVLDENLSWKEHVKYVLSKAGKRVGMLGRLRKNLTTYAADTVYKSYILPVLDYCDSAWTTCNKGDTESLERLQRRAARIVMRCDADTAFNNLKWTTLVNRRNQHVLNLVNKCLQKQVPQFLTDIFRFNREVISRTTRQSNLLHVPKVRIEATKKAFYYNGCLVFNNFN